MSEPITSLCRKRLLNNSDVVIWAWGYESRPIPITVHNPLSNKLEVLDCKRVGQNQFEVDDDLRLVVKNSIKTYNLFGIGLGYSIKTTNKHVKAEKNLNSRADGVRLYATIVPFVLYSGIWNKKINQRSFKENIESRAFSMQRVISNASAGLYNKQRVNSVNKDINSEITPIEEITINPNKLRKKRHNADKKQKGERVENNIKERNKNVKSKYMDKKINENMNIKADKGKLIDSDEEWSPKQENSNIHTPIQRNDKTKEKNNLVKAKKLSTLEDSEKESLRKNLNKKELEIDNIETNSRTKDQTKYYLDSDKSESLIAHNPENNRFYKTEQNMLNDFPSSFKETNNNMSIFLNNIFR